MMCRANNAPADARALTGRGSYFAAEAWPVQDGELTRTTSSRRHLHAGWPEYIYDGKYGFGEFTARILASDLWTFFENCLSNIFTRRRRACSLCKENWGGQ